MKRLRVWIQAEYEFSDSAELIEIGGEKAIRIDGRVVKPSLDFDELQEETATSSIWTDASEELYEQVLAAEKRLVIDVLDY